MKSRHAAGRIWILATLAAGAIAIVLDALGTAQVGTIRLAITTAFLAPGLVVLFVVNGGNPHFDLAGPDHILLVLVTAVLWGTVFWGALWGLNWLRQRAARLSGVGAPPAA